MSSSPPDSSSVQDNTLDAEERPPATVPATPNNSATQSPATSPSERVAIDFPSAIADPDAWQANLNPADNYAFATMIGNFQDGSVAGKLQFGSGWWFLDQIDGMTRQIEALSQIGLLGRFVGMLTDSRSFLSYTRHEYFRRLLCNIIGSDVERGLIPDNDELLAPLVQDICYRNARNYFGFPIKD